MNKYINLIVAVDSSYGISKGLYIPWHIKQDLQYFYNKTVSTVDNTKMNAIIMGKNSWKTIPDKHRGLIGRLNVILSTTMTHEELEKDNIQNVKTLLARNLQDGLNMCIKDPHVESIFICGGSSIYKQALNNLNNNLISNCYITKIGRTFECDNFFPVDTFNNYIKNMDVDYEIDEQQIIINNEIVPLSFNHYKLSYNNVYENGYLNLLKSIIQDDSVGRNTRNAPTYSIFGPQIEFDLREGFPLLTTKRMFWRGIVEELLFFLKGDTNANNLAKKGVHIWDQNTTREFLDSRGLNHYEVGDMGPMYGYNWRHFSADYTGINNNNNNNKGFDQLKDVLTQLIKDPTSRRIMMTTFDPSKVKESVLAPCHGLVIQFYVDNNYLDCKMYQRSVDTFLGLPFNIASYALLMHIICHILKYTPRRLILTFGDCHIYKDHVDMVMEQLSRKPYKFPSLEIKKEFINNMDNIDNMLSFMENLQFDDFVVHNYNCHPIIKAPMFC
jgi:dihydrofolate reductase/thymidylate synthase